MLAMKTIDAHVGGQPFALVVEGFPSVRGKTMGEKREWAARHADHLRRALMLEPRGHAGMTGAVLTEPVMPGSDAGVLFMDTGGFARLSGHGVIAAAAIVRARRLIVNHDEAQLPVFDTPAGTIRIERMGEEGKPVAFVGVPSFVLQAGVEIPIENRRVRADIASGGLLYAIVDAEAAGLPLDPPHMPELRRAGLEIVCAVGRSHTFVHPGDGRPCELDGVVFTGPSRNPAADLRNVTVTACGQIQRSASGTATAAVLAVLDEMGLIDPSRPFVHEGIAGTTLTGQIAVRTIVGDHAAVVPRIEGTAWFMGERLVTVHPDDPVAAGLASA